MLLTFPQNRSEFQEAACNLAIRQRLGFERGLTLNKFTSIRLIIVGLVGAKVQWPAVNGRPRPGGRSVLHRTAKRRPYLRLIANTIVAGMIFPRVRQSSLVLIMVRRP